MAVLEARIFASVYGTAAELGASTVVLGRGERWYRTDAPIVTDPSSPFYNQRDPSKQWKTGDNTKTWGQITQYDPIGTGTTTGGGSVPDLNPFTVLANIEEEGAAGQSLLIAPDETTAEGTPTLAGLMGALTNSHYNALTNLIGTVTETESETGGLRGVLNRFTSITPIPTITVTGTITNGSATVALASPLDSRIGSWARVFVMSGGTGVANPAYINAIASDRMSFTLTSSMFNFVDGAGTPMLATATGSRTLEIRDPGGSVHGVQLAGLPRQNVYNGNYDWRSTPNSLGSDTLTGETTQSRVKDGILHWRAAQVNGGAWEQVTGAVDLVLLSRQIVAAVGPATHHTWTGLPAADTEFMGETQGRHRFRLMIPDDTYTQFLLGVDQLIVAGTNTSTMWVEFLDPADSVWKDLTTARVTVSLNTPIDTYKESALGTLTAAAKAAAANNARSIWCRVMGKTTGAATGNPQFTNVWTLVK